MAVPTHRVISIGALAAHPLWDESRPVRTGHATCSLIQVGDVNLIVNPGLPPTALQARMSERTNCPPDRITHVFLTSFTPDHYRGLQTFPEATWLVHEPEREAAERAMQQQLEGARETGDPEIEHLAAAHLELLKRTRDAPDRIAPGVDLFPLPGATPGCCGLLLPLPIRTILIAGDAVATREHVEQAKVLPGCADVEQAMESFREAIEIADEIVLGRDEALSNPARRGF
jgi:glyoxylase-like metal-dependent hydrolase (beta-lactamase superfamily II)